jgi:hypothetical protein
MEVNYINTTASKPAVQTEVSTILINLNPCKNIVPARRSPPRQSTPVIPEGTLNYRGPDPNQFRFSGENPGNHGTTEVMIPTIC